MKKTIGILGGSFNPMHSGHITIAKEAKKIGCDEIWLIITPQNPLKKTTIKPIEERYKEALKFEKPDYIKIKILEESDKQNYSYNLITELINGSDKKIWLMGGDCLQNFHLWYKWQEIAEMINILIFPRNNISYKETIFYQKFHKFYLQEAQIKDILTKPSPCWTIAKMKEINLSSTMIRKKL